MGGYNHTSHVGPGFLDSWSVRRALPAGQWSVARVVSVTAEGRRHETSDAVGSESPEPGKPQRHVRAVVAGLCLLERTRLGDLIRSAHFHSSVSGMGCNENLSRLVDYRIAVMLANSVYFRSGESAESSASLRLVMNA